MTIEKSIIIAAVILGLAHIATPIALYEYKLIKCTYAGDSGDREASEYRCIMKNM